MATIPHNQNNELPKRKRKTNLGNGSVRVEGEREEPWRRGSARNHEKRRVVVTANIKKTKLVGIRPPPWFSLKEESPLPA
jgi:hypothetical protein